MRKLIKSSTGKYIVNVLMIVIFAALAFTGLFGSDGGKDREGRDHRHKQFAEVQEKTVADESAVAANFISNDLSAQGQGKEEEGNHEIYGIIWLFLMAFHTWQHWNWYNLLFSRRHIMKNKLLTATVFLFVLMALSSIALLTEIIPRDLINMKEFHETVGQLMVAFIILHIIQRIKWYITNTQKLFGPKVTTVSTI